MGHVFDRRAGDQPEADLTTAQITDPDTGLLIAGSGVYLDNTGYACAGRFCTWQQNNNPNLGGNSANEEFADMFLGWSYNHFAGNAAGAARYGWMQSHMPSWIERARGQ